MSKSIQNIKKENNFTNLRRNVNLFPTYILHTLTNIINHELELQKTVKNNLLPFHTTQYQYYSISN